MDRHERGVFFGAAKDNLASVVAHSILGAVLLGSTVGFSALLALYFGHDVIGLAADPTFGWIVESPEAILFAATTLAIAALVARIGQSVLEAKVVVQRERWFAEKLRRDERSAGIAANQARASSYYGRMSNAAMKAVSTGVVLALNIAFLSIIVPPAVAGGILLTLAIIAGALFAIMRRLSRAMSKSSIGLTANAKPAVVWKMSHSAPWTPEVEAYFRSYFFRLFLASSFSFAAPIFGVCLCLVLLAARELASFDFSFAQAFMAFVIMQAYVGLMGNLLGSLVHGAAFLPAVLPYIDPERSGNQMPTNSEDITVDADLL